MDEVDAEHAEHPRGPGGPPPVERRCIETLYRAFNEGRPELLDGVLAEDWEDHPPAPGQEPGREGLKKTIPGIRAAFAELRFAPEDITGEAGRVAVRLVLSGRHVGEWMGVAATGRPFRIAMHEFHHLDGGRITKTWHVEDWAAWREQVGASAAG